MCSSDLQQTLLLGIGLSAGTAREHNRFKDLVPINRHYNGTLRIVMGKGLSYFMVYSIISVYVLCVVPRIFNLNQIGQPDALILFMLLSGRLHILCHDCFHCYS